MFIAPSTETWRRIKGVEPGAWSLELGAWSLELGAWSLELGAWRSGMLEEGRHGNP